MFKLLQLYVNINFIYFMPDEFIGGNIKRIFIFRIYSTLTTFLHVKLLLEGSYNIYISAGL